MHWESFLFPSCTALAREGEGHDVYQQFLDATASYRYKGYQAFHWSLILLITDIFLFALAYLPEPVQPFAALGSLPIIYTCWKDWQAIVSAASMIYTPNKDDFAEDAINDAESRRTK